jgi:hypothetical protein
MSVPPENRLVDPEQLIADLQRHFAECKAKRDEPPQSEIGTRGGVAGHQFLARRPRATIHDPPAVRQALGNDKGCLWTPVVRERRALGRGSPPHTDFTDYPRT